MRKLIFVFPFLLPHPVLFLFLQTFHWPLCALLLLCKMEVIKNEKICLGNPCAVFHFMRHSVWLVPLYWMFWTRALPKMGLRWRQLLLFFRWRNDRGYMVSPESPVRCDTPRIQLGGVWYEHSCHHRKRGDQIYQPSLAGYNNSSRLTSCPDASWIFRASPGDGRLRFRQTEWIIR